MASDGEETGRQALQRKKSLQAAMCATSLRRRMTRMIRASSIDHAPEKIHATWTVTGRQNNGRLLKLVAERAARRVAKSKQSQGKAAQETTKLATELLGITSRRLCGE